MNIFTAAVTGLTIVIKKIGIAFKAVLTGLKIVIIAIADFIISVITAIINAIVSAIQWAWTQFVNVIHWLFRTYLRFEAGCVPPVQKLVGLLIRMRWGFVIISGLYAVYKYFGITYLLVSIVVCVVLVCIGYSEAETEEERWNVVIAKVNKIIEYYLKYFVRLLPILLSSYMILEPKVPENVTSILHERVSKYLTVKRNYIKHQSSFYGYGDFNGDGEQDIAIGAKLNFNKTLINSSSSLDQYNSIMEKTYVLWGPSFSQYVTIDYSNSFNIIKNNIRNTDKKDDFAKKDVFEAHDRLNGRANA
jgi:hypothetical protein